MIWFISDTHWGHKNILRYSNRNFANVDEMNAKLIENWNAVVKPTDTVYHLGDVAFMPWRDFLQTMHSLNGHKHLILGNHDKMIIENWDKLLNQKIFDSIQYYYELKHNKQKFVLFHFGQRVWNKSHHGSIHLYGHSHGSLPPHGKSVDVGVDAKFITEEYRPVSIDEVIAYMDKREMAVVDHHGDNDD